MKNYIKIANFSDFPELKGFQYSHGNLVRTYCKCGFVDCAIVDKCPDCGNTTFMTNKKRNTTTQIVQAQTNSYDDPLAIHESIEYFSIVKNQATITRIKKEQSSHYTTLMANLSNSAILPWFEDPMFLSYPEYVVAKKLFMKYNNNMQWNQLLRFVLKAKKELGKRFDYDEIESVIDCIGTENLYSKFQHINNTYRGLTIPDIVRTVETMHPTLRMLCEHSPIFKYAVCDGRANEGNSLPTELLDFMYAYVHANYLAANKVGDIISILYSLKIQHYHVEPIIKFIKECYSDINNNAWCIREFVEFITQHGFTSVKDYFLHKNMLYLTRSYKKNVVDDAMLDVYENPAQVFIKIANF